MLGEVYGSTVETRFARDLPQVLAWIDGGPEPETVQIAHFYADRLYGLKTRRSAAYKGIHALLMRHEARDFVRGEKIDESIYFDEALEIHHIFPRAWCQNHGKEERKSESILNKTPISRRANRAIGGDAPSHYLPRLEERFQFSREHMDAVLSSHLIDPQEIRSDNFENFIESRRQLLLEAIGQARGKDVVGGTDAEGGQEVVIDEVGIAE